MISKNDLNHFLRPNLWPVILAIFTIGWLAAGNFIISGWIIGAIISILLCSASIVVNHYFDFDSDKLSKQNRFPVAAGLISRNFALSLGIGLSIASILIAIILGINQFMIVLIGIFWVWAYSAPPLRIKKRTYLDTIWNSIGYGILPFYLGYLMQGTPIDIYAIALSSITALIVTSGHLLLAVRDIDTDKSAGIKTMTAVAGRNFTIKVSTALVGLAGLLLFALWASGYLNNLALLSLAMGGIILKKHKIKIEENYRSLQITYVIAGLAFVASVL